MADLSPIINEFFSLVTPPRELLLRGLWGGVGLAGLGVVIWHIVDAVRIGRSMEYVLGALKSIKKDKVIAKFGPLKDRFLKDPTFSNHWQEFEATLVIREDAILTTTDASYFFNEYTLVDGPMHMEFKRHVPAILTSLGIIGTFAGLLIGLKDFNDANLQESISNLLGGVNNAFACSFAAIMMAVIVTITERFVITRLYAKVHQVQENLNRLFNRSLTESYLHDMLGQMDEQTQSLKSFSQDLSQSIQQAMQELVHFQTTAIQQANAEVAERITGSMNQILAPAIDRISNAVVEMQRQQTESSEEALRNLIDQFGQSLQQSTGKQMESAMAAIVGTTDTMNSLRDEFAGFMAGMREQMAAQQDQVHAQMAALSSQSSEQQTKLQTELSEFVTRTATMLAGLQQDMATNSSAHAGKINEAVEALLKQSQQTTGEMADQQERYAQRLTELMAHMQEMMKNFDLHIGRHEGMVEGMAMSIQQAKQAVQQMAQATEQYTRLQTQAQQLVQQASAQIGAVDQRLALFSQSNAQMKDTVDHHGRMLSGVKGDTEAFFGSVRSGVTAYQDAVQQSMEKYHNVASASLGKFLAEVENQMGQAVKSLGTSVSSLDEALEDLAEQLEKVKR